MSDHEELRVVDLRYFGQGREPTVEELAEALIERKGPPTDWLMPVIRKWFSNESGPDRVLMALAFDEAVRGKGVSDE